MASTTPVDQLLAFNVSRESLAKLETYVELLLQWQRHINLVGPSTTETIWNRHVLDAVQLLPLLASRKAERIADLGSGAGVPGLVLSLAGSLDAHLYESKGKKVAFLRETIRQTSAKAQVHQLRLESLAKITDLPNVDAVVARALAPLSQLLDYAAPFLEMGAIAYFHKGQDVDAELTAATKCWRIKFARHPSHTDSRAAILEVMEAVRVR